MRPQLALAENFLDLKADYAAARASRFRRIRSVPSLGSAADYHYHNESDWLRILEYARDMDRNDAIVGQTIDRAVVNTVQTGFDLEFQIPQNDAADSPPDEALNKDLWARFDAWAGDPNECDEAGELTLWQMDELLLRQRFVDGDIFQLPLDNRRLQLVEAHRARTPGNTKRNVVHGVLLSPARRRLQYWFTRDEIDPGRPVSRVGDVAPYEAWRTWADGSVEKNVFHIYDPKRVSQTRGLSALCPIFDLCGMFEDIQFAKLVQQQVVSCFAVFRELDVNARPGTAPQLGNIETETRGDGSSRTVQGISPGMQITGRPGERLQGFSPSVPNPEFFEHIKLILTLIGVNLGLPLVLVLVDASETNFSGWRGAVDQARMGFRRNQKSLIVQSKRNVVRWWLRMEMIRDAALRGRYQVLGEKLFRHTWNAPRWPYIQPLQDAQADELRLAARLISPRRLHAERGQDYDDVLNETVADNAAAIRKAIEAAQAITAETRVEVDWHELLTLPAAKDLSGSLASGGRREDAETRGRGDAERQEPKNQPDDDPEDDSAELPDEDTE